MGLIRIREQAVTPATPTEGVILFPTVATPSVLKMLDDAGLLTTFALLERAQNFTATQTIAPTATNVDGVIVNMPALNSKYSLTLKYAGTDRSYFEETSIRSQLVFSNFDNGSDVGPTLVLGRNNNASTPSAGFLYVSAKGGTAYAIWPDNSGNLRIGTSTPTNANDLSGTVVGTQTSSLDTKDVIDEFIDNGMALNAILATPLYLFRYKNNLYDQDFMGIVTDHAPLFGVDKDEAHPTGKSLNVINAHGYTMAAIKALAAQVQELKKEIETLKRQ